MAIYQRGETWHCDFTVAHRRVRRSLGTDSRPEALRRERELIRSLKPEDAGHTLHQALILWVDERPRGPRDASILKRLTQRRDMPLSAVDEAAVRELLADLGPSSYDRTATVIRAAMNLAKDAGWIESVPKIKKRDQKPPADKFLTPAEWQRLRRQLRGSLLDLADFAIATGLRQGSILKMEWRQVDLDRRVAWVTAAQAKARKTITVPLSEAAAEVLTRQVGRHQTRVFAWGKKQPRPYASTPKTAWLRAVRAADLEWCTFHHLRHTWASWHVQNGTPLAVLQKLGAWASLDMVQRYAHLAPDHLAAYANNSAPKKRRKAA